MGGNSRYSGGPSMWGKHSKARGVLLALVVLAAAIFFAPTELISQRGALLRGLIGSYGGGEGDCDQTPWSEAPPAISAGAITSPQDYQVVLPGDSVACTAANASDSDTYHNECGGVSPVADAVDYN